MKAGGYLVSMEKFSTFFGLKHSHLVFSRIEQLSISLQGKDTPTQEAVSAADLAIKFLRDQRGESVFESFYGQVIECAKDLIKEPALPRYAGQSSRFDSPKEYFARTTHHL